MTGLRLEEQLALYGANRLADIELLTVLVGFGPATSLMLRFESVERVASTSAAMLLEAGLDDLQIRRLQASIELGRRLSCRPVKRLEEFNTTADVGDYFVPRLGHLQTEQLWLVLLDCRNRLLGLRQVGQGGQTGVAVEPADILRPALEEGAVQLILVHNHPSGDPTPSDADRSFTRRVREAAQLLGLSLLDHVVVSSQGAVSV